jgi:radical SAM protein with 4Fe4S-binding SPASM domain
MTKQNNDVFKLHQFVDVVKGPANALITDLLTGNFFHVPRESIERFEAGDYENIKEFLEAIQEENLVIEVAPDEWIPDIYLEEGEDPEDEKEILVELHIEQGADIKGILYAFREYPVNQIYFYGKEIPPVLKNRAKVNLKAKNFDDCLQQATVDGNFCKVQESVVRLNRMYNTCWGTAIAFTADGNIRPCIHSHTAIGTIEKELKDIDGLVEKMKPYWRLTKGKVERCRDCEFRYVCFDCREIAMRKTGALDSANPLCAYNPYTGDWEQKKRN